MATDVFSVSEKRSSLRNPTTHMILPVASVTTFTADFSEMEIVSNEAKYIDDSFPYFSLINIDGTCNRVGGLLYGHEKVYLVVGVNKIAPDYDAALFRARNVAAPLNARRLDRKTPCAQGKELKCYNCASPERICRALTVLWTKPGGADYEIVLIDEPMGY